MKVQKERICKKKPSIHPTKDQTGLGEDYYFLHPHNFHVYYHGVVKKMPPIIATVAAHLSLLSSFPMSCIENVLNYVF